MSSSTMYMSQAKLGELLISLGWAPEASKSYGVHGIAIHAASPNGYVLSIQASGSNYCSPRRNGLTYYRSVELAVWSSMRPHDSARSRPGSP